MPELELLIRALLVGLAGWRVASLLVQEDGPFEVFTRLRKLAGHDEVEVLTMEPEHWFKGFFYSIFGCVWCMSIWTVGGAWWLWEASPAAVALGAASAVAILVQRRAVG